VPDGSALRLLLKLANGADGATGTLVSVDQALLSCRSRHHAERRLDHRGSERCRGKFAGDLKGAELAVPGRRVPVPCPSP